MKTSKAAWVCLTIVYLILAATALAQSTAALNGRVVDPGDAIITGARVEALNIDTNAVFTTLTNNDGLFALPNLPLGRYRVTVSREGFQAIVKPDIVLHVQDVIALNFTMQVGSITQSVTVQGGAPLVQTESATVGTLVDRQFLENIPLNGRSFQALIELTPGVVIASANGLETGQFSVDGQRTDANYFMVDGVSANTGIGAAGGVFQSGAGALPQFSVAGTTTTLVSVDAMQEFKIQTSMFSPEYGRTPGAQVSVATRSGTNQFHGTLFEYFRNSALDSNDWFANANRLDKPAMRQNDFGGVLGGPIIRDRTFFFYSNEQLLLRQPKTNITPVPDLASRQAAPPSVQPYLNAFPIPNGPDLGSGSAQFAGSYSDPSRLYSNSIRIDQFVSTKLTLFGRFSDAPSNGDQRRPDISLNTITKTTLNNDTVTIGAIWSITPAIVNDFRGNYSWSQGGSTFRLDNFGGATPLTTAQLFGIPNPGQYNLFIAGFGGPLLIAGNFVTNWQRQINLVDTVSFVHGAHQFKAGVDYRHLNPVVSSLDLGASIFFNTVQDSLSGVAPFVSISNNDEVGLSMLNFSAYAQDTWHVLPRLTLTFGVRWELNPAPSGTDGHGLINVTGADDPATLALTRPGTPLWNTRYNNFAPRFGFAYQQSADPRFGRVFRGGFGMFYDLGTGPAGGAGSSFPYNRSAGYGNITLPLPADLLVPVPFSLTPPYSFLIFGAADQHLKLPYTMQGNFTLDQSLGNNQVLSASYVTALGRHLLRTEDPNEGYVNPNFLDIYFTRSVANSEYHALQAQFKRRLSAGLQVLASYTWAHSIDEVSTEIVAQLPLRLANLKQDRGPSDFDFRHTFSFAITYNAPAPRWNAFANAVLSHWAIDTLFRARSAGPVNITTFDPSYVVGQLVPRPDLVPGQSLSTSDSNVAGGKRFNADAFATPPANQQGELGRNALRGFGASELDLAVRREFPITERLRLQFRAEMFNLFNHPDFANPISNLQNPLFGISTSTLAQSLGGAFGAGLSQLYQMGGPRSVQLAMKLTF